MQFIAWCALVVCWFAWGYPFIFRAPHKQKRPSVVARAPSIAGLLLEAAAVCVAFACRLESPPGDARSILSVALAIVGGLVPFGAVRHLGRQFRIQAGLYEDHMLVRSGPYALVRHPIYLGYLIAHVGFVLVNFSWRNLAVFALLYAVQVLRIGREEAVLAGSEAYRAYQCGVRWRLLPCVF